MGGGDTFSAPRASDDPVAALEKLGIRIEWSEQSEVVCGSPHRAQITDRGLLHLKEMTKLERRELWLTQTNGAEFGCNLR